MEEAMSPMSQSSSTPCPSSPINPINLSVSAGGKNRKCFLIDSLLDSILERQKASKFVGETDGDTAIEEGEELNKCRIDNDENATERAEMQKKGHCPLPTTECSGSDQEEQEDAGAPGPLIDESSLPPPSDPSPSTSNHSDEVQQRSTASTLPQNNIPFLNLLSRFGGLNDLYFQQQQQNAAVNMECLNRLRFLQNTAGFGPVFQPSLEHNNRLKVASQSEMNGNLYNCFQKNPYPILQQQALAVAALKHRMATTALLQSSNMGGGLATNNIESAHKKLLAKQIINGGQPSSRHSSTSRADSTIAVAASLGAFRAAIAASSLAAHKPSKTLQKHGSTKRLSPPSTSSSQSTKFQGNSRRRGEVTRHGLTSSSGEPVTRSSNAKKYRCDICEKTFSRSNTLITHKVGLIERLLV